MKSSKFVKNIDAISNNLVLEFKNIDSTGCNDLNSFIY